MQKAFRRNPALAAWALLLPATVWLVLFFIAPLFIVLIYSFLERGTYGGVQWIFTLENIERVIDPLYLKTFLRSVYIAVLTTIFCLLIGYPLAYFIATRPHRLRYSLLLALMIPLFGYILGVEEPPKDFREYGNGDDSLYEKLAYELIRRGVMPDSDGREPWFLSFSHDEHVIDETLSIFEDSVKAILD